MKYYISDLHLGHANVIKHDGRPFADVEEMDRSLIKMWNDTVGDDDDIYIVGDFCYRSGKTADWYLSRLKGRKHLIVGNHDWQTLKNEKAMAMFESVDKILEIEDNGRHIVLCHYPMAEWPRSRHGGWLIYGHIHTRKDKTWEFMRTLDHALTRLSKKREKTPALPEFSLFSVSFASVFPLHQSSPSSIVLPSIFGRGCGGRRRPSCERTSATPRTRVLRYAPVVMDLAVLES